MSEQPEPFLDHVAEPLDQALRSLVQAPRLLVALDFDGVLAPLVDDPNTSRILPASVPALAQLAALDDVTLAILSGREAEQLVSLAEVPAGTKIVGSHGVQLGHAARQGERLVYIGEPLEFTETEMELHQRLRDHLAELVPHISGAWTEVKPASLVVHTRACHPADGERLRQLVLDGPARLPGVRAQEGKEVVELAVRHRTKGDGLTELREELAVDAVLFAGDDITDEDGFAVLTEEDAGIKVGSGDTAADYRVATPEAFAFVLMRLAELRREEKEA